ncbi:UNVERIFIED_CONTAM: hypothetical protein O8I53_06475 [Campylobacter lari]
MSENKYVFQQTNVNYDLSKFIDYGSEGFREINENLRLKQD